MISVTLVDRKDVAGEVLNMIPEAGAPMNINRFIMTVEQHGEAKVQMSLRALIEELKKRGLYIISEVDFTKKHYVFYIMPRGVKKKSVKRKKKA